MATNMLGSLYLYSVWAARGRWFLSCIRCIEAFGKFFGLRKGSCGRDMAIVAECPILSLQQIALVFLAYTSSHFLQSAISSVGASIGFYSHSHLCLWVSPHREMSTFLWASARDLRSRNCWHS